ncbi:MAG: hypothetical protein ABH829_01335 [archaeon]
MPKPKKPEKKPKSPLIAAILSFLIPGLGQLYKGEGRLALLMFLAWAAVTLVARVGIVVSIICAWDAYTGRISGSFYGRKTAPAERRAERAPAKPTPKRLKVSKPKPAAEESPEKVLVRTLLDVAVENDYYKVQLITNRMAERYPEEQDWLNTKWVGRALNELGFTERRRQRSGMQVRLSPETVRETARKLGVLVYRQ